MWTNTCCSHPQHIETELDTTNNYIGIRRAAVRRTAFELGIHDLSVDMMDVGSRILYFADADEHFAEHELDYILFAKFNPQPFVVNFQEV